MRTLSVLTLTVFSLSLAPVDTFAQNRDVIHQVQNALKEHGYDPGPTDGVWGKRTEDALKKYQQDNTLQVTGRLDSETLRHLGIKASIQESASASWRHFVDRDQGRYCFQNDSRSGQLTHSYTLTVDVSANAARAQFTGVVKTAGGAEYLFNEEFEPVWRNDELVLKQNGSEHPFKRRNRALVGKHPILDLGDASFTFTMKNCTQ